MFTLIKTPRLTGVDRRAWLADVLRHRIDGYPVARLGELLLQNWRRADAVAIYGMYVSLIAVGR
jgi:hypothetical protein